MLQQSNFICVEMNWKACDVSGVNLYGEAELSQSFPCQYIQLLIRICCASWNEVKKECIRISRILQSKQLLQNIQFHFTLTPLALRYTHKWDRYAAAQRDCSYKNWHRSQNVNYVAIIIPQLPIHFCLLNFDDIKFWIHLKIGVVFEFAEEKHDKI